MADPKAAMAAILEKYSPKNNKSVTTGSKTTETESTSKAKKAMDEILEKYSPKPDVLDDLPGLRGKETEIFKPSPIYDYTGASRKKAGAKQTADPDIEYDSGSVLKLGAGPLSNNAVTSGVVSGKLELTSQNKDGKYSVEKNKDYVAPRKQAEIIDRSAARMAELEAVKNPSETQIEELAIIKKELAERAEASKLREERELGDNWFSWLGRSRDSTLPLSPADTQAQKAIGNSVGAAAQNVAGSLMSVIATLNELDARTRARDEADSAKLKAAQSALEKGEEVDLSRSDKTWRADMTEKSDEYTAKVKNDLAHEFSDILMNNAVELQNEAYKAAGDEGKFLVDLLYTGTQMAGDLISNLIVPGSGLWFMSARVFGQSAYEARENGADAATQFVTGLKSAVIEYLTERLGGGPFKKIYGAGMVDNAIESVLGRLFKTNTGRTVIRYIMNAVNEGNEEVLSDVLNPVADRLLGLDDGEGSLFTDEDLGQMWYDWMLGTALGGIGGAVNLGTGSYAQQNADLRLTESAQKALVESGLESDTNTESYKLAEKYKKTLDSGRLLSNKQVQKLTEANDAAIRNEVALQSAIDAVKETVPERAARMFAERGEQASPELINGVTNLVTDQQVTQEQVAAIVASDNSAEVVQQLAQEYITQEAPEVQEPVESPMELWDQDNIVESMFPNEVKSGILTDDEVARFQSYYDESGRSIDLNELEAMVRDYIENKKEAKTYEGRKQSSDRSMGREPDVDPGEQTGSVQKSAGRAEKNKRAERGGEGARREDIQKAHRVSSKEIGLRNGTDKQNLEVVHDKKLHPATQRIIKAFDKAANGITAVKGRLEVKQGIIQGVTTPDGKVIFRTDHAVYGQEEILLHECGHLYIRGDRALKNALMDACLESMTEKELHQLSIKYGSLWQGLMSEDITDEEFLDSMLEEIYCDALAGIDRINASGAGLLTEAVRSVFAEETGIDVNALLNGAEAVTQTAAKTGESKAAKTEPRNNGPPADYKYSFGGENARTANIKTLEEAKRLENESIDSETIRQQTGWHRGYDGKWRFEIDDSSAYFEKEPNLETHYANTDDSYQTGRLGDIFRHRDLYEAYPQLEDYIVIIQETETGNEGAFFPGRNEIVLSRELFKRYTKEYKDYLNGGRRAEIEQIESTPEYKEYSKFYDDEELQNLDPEDWLELEEVARNKFFSSELGKRYYQLQWGNVDIRKYEAGWSDGAKSVLLHEIQHAVQNIEGTSRGSSPGYWNRRMEEGLSVYRNDRRIEAADREYRDIFENAPEIFKNKVREINRARLNKDYDTAERIVDELYESEYSDLYSRLDMADFIRRGDRGEKLTAGDLYELTAGEIEARDTSNRGELTAEQRKNIRPDIDRTDAVFAEAGVKFFSKKSEYDSESATLKQQIIYASSALNKMEVVASESITNADFKNKADAKNWVNNALKKWNGKVDRQGFGIILFSKTDIDYAVEHLKDKYQQAALCALPKVLKRGIQIGEHNNHKARGKHTVTIGAPIEINGIRGNMGVVVNMNGKHAYSARVLLPDGSVFVFSEKEETPQGMHQGVLKNESLADTTSDVSDDSIFPDTEKVNSYSVDDTAYMEAVERGDMETAQRMVDDAAKEWGAMANEDGTPMVVYHGTSDTFWTFDTSEISPIEGSFFFAQNREDAAAYSGNGRIMDVYVNLHNPVDYNNMPSEIYRLKNKRAQVEALKKLGYDGWIADMDTGWGEISAFYPEQIKSADPVTYDDNGNVIPLSERFNEDNEDIRYSADDVELNYESLVKKPDMILTTVVNSYGMSREDIVSEGKTNAASVGYVNESGVPVVFIKDTKSEIRVTNKGLRHGLRRKYSDNGSVTAKAGEILSNSIKINELSARKNSPNGSDVLIGAARQGKNIYIVRSIVSKGSNELEEIDTLYAIDTKIESAALNAPGNPDNPFPVTNSKISIAKLLEYVNRYFPDILPTDILRYFGREIRPKSSVSNSVLYSADDALLVESDPDYADTLSKVREDARRYSAAKLEERISNFDGRIKGYEETANRTERMELELEDLRNRRKVYSDALRRKKAKNDERRQANETAKTEAKATAQRITEVQGRNRSKATLRDTIFRDFNIQEGRSEAADVINAFADKYAEQGRISRKDLNGLFDTLMEKGLFVAEAEDYARELRAHLAGSSVRVPSYVKAEFGDDWINFYRRAWANKIYLKIDSGSNGIDTWTQELAGSFGEGTFDTSADLKTQLERIVELAEQGRDEKMDLFHMADYIRRREGRDTADAIVDELYTKLEDAVKTYASNAKLEMELTYKNAFQQARDRAIRQENARRAQEKKELRERQQDTLKQLQILKMMRDTTSQEFREQIDRVLDDIDTIAVSAANAMNYSDKYNATWGSLVAMYKEAQKNDPNWLPDAYVDKLMERIDGKHLDEMEPADLEQLYQAAVALRTKIYNTRNIIGSETNMMFSEAYDSVRGEMHSASKPKNRYGAKWKAMRHAMNPNHYLECLAGWNPDSVWYKTFAKGLEDGERKMKRYVETSKQMLDEFARTHRKWLEVADGQGKNGIWYEVKVSPVAEWRKGDQPIFGEPITVYMTPLQKVHMYLESKNYDNLSHMLGGRVFADKELYSKGNKDEAFASDPIHLAPADVRRISSDLTEEEMELANILERYYNTYAKSEINKVSNELYGFDRAMAGNYAPIFTKKTYNTFTPAIIDGTAEGVGHMKTRIKGARTPTVNISAMDAFNKHVSQTSRFVGMSIPLHNMNGILNWTQNGKPMREVIEQEWSNGDLEYVEKLVTELQNPHFADEGYIEKTIDKIQSAYIGSVFGFNPSVALKVFGSWNLASAELGFENVKGAFIKVDPELIRKYTSEYDVRVRGYASPEVARLVNSQSKIEKLIQGNKFTKELLGGGMMIHTDAIVARSMWAWAEAAVRNENPDLEIGTQEQIDAGQSPFYKAVAERYNTAIGNTQSMYDIMHRSALLRDEGAVSRAFTMFHTDIMQAANLLMKAKGEHDYYRKALAADPENKALQAKAAKYEHSVGKAAAGVVTSSMLVALVSVLNSLYKRRDEFYDENNEFMWDKFGVDYAIYILKDFFGMLPGVDVVAGGLIDHFRGEKWYDVEVMGLSLFNDLVDKGIKVAAKIIDGTATLEDYKDLAFLVARRFSLPFDNVERYMLGLFSWVAPEIGEAYNNMISPPDKSDLKGKTGDVLEQDIYDMYKQFGLDRETTDELSRLYDLGYDKIIYGKTPEHITQDGIEYELDDEASERYSAALYETLSKLGEVISSDEYQEADDKERMGMLKRLNAYATETAKAAAVPEYDMSQWAESCKGLVDSGESIMTVAMMPYTEKAASSSSGEDNDPRYVKFIKAGVEYNNARDIDEKLTTLVPENGAKSVTQTQKVAAIAYMPIPEDEKSAAIKLIYGTTGAKSFERYQTATNAGLSSADYADFLAALDRINNNSGVSQEEFKQAVRESGMPDDVAAQLWATYGWKKAYSRN